MAGNDYAEYLVQLPTALAIPSGTYNQGLKVLWGAKINNMLAGPINAATIADIWSQYGTAGTTLADKERQWLVSKIVPPGTIADMRQYLVFNNLMPT